MLQGMRKVAKSWVSSIFLGALALSFVVWGIADIFHANVDTDAATVGDTKITADELQQEYRSAIRTQSQQLGVQLTNEQARAMGLGQSTLDRIITRAALDNVVSRLGLTASDAFVAGQIHGMQAFDSALGTFDHNQFLRVLQESGFTEQGFIDAVRQDSARNQLVAAAENGFVIPNGYARALFAFLNEARAAEYVVVPPEAVGAVPTPTDAVLTTFLKAHTARFSTPEYRSLVYASISPSDVMNQVHVTDAQLHQAYDLKRSIYVVPERRELSQLTFPTENEAKAARAKMDAGASFDDIVKARGLASKDTSLGALTTADLDTARSAAAFALPEGGTTQPVKSSFGWVILHVSKITAGSTKTFDDVKAELKSDLLARLAADRLVTITNDYTDAYSSGASLEEAAKKVGMHLHNVAALDRTGLTPDGSKADVPGAQDFLDQMFTAEIGEEGDPFSTKDGNAYVIKVGGVTPPKLKPLDTVRAEATAAWTLQERTRLLIEKTKAMAAQATREGSLANIARAVSAPIQRTAALQRRIPNPALGPDVVEALFESAPGVAVQGASLKGGGFVIARTTGVIHPPTMAADPQFQRGVRELSRQIAPDLTVSMAKAARAEQGVTINRQNVDRVIGGSE